jgi:hypothetical protein
MNLAAPALLAREASCRRLWAVLVALAAALLGVGRAEPPTYHRVEELDWRLAEIARRDVAVTTAREYTPLGMRRRPPAPAPAAPFAEEGDAAEVRGASWAPRSRQAEVHVRTAAAVVSVPVADFPGWTVYLDGAETPRLPPRPDGLLRVRVPTGSHRLEARFEETPIRQAGNWISVIVLFGLVAAAAAARWSRRWGGSAVKQKPGPR